MNHTPGPWTERAPEIGGVVSENYREVVGGVTGGVEPQTDDMSLWGHENLKLVGFMSPANARLIAAAPDMLALLRTVAMHFNGTDAPLGYAAKALVQRVSKVEEPSAGESVK